MSGIYVRNTENPLYQSKEIYHPFDGDGMLHAMSFKDGKASYRNRFVRTTGFLKEQAAGRTLWAGIAERPSIAEHSGWGARGRMKDASSTDVVVHGGDILSTFYMCGDGYQLDPYTLEDKGKADWVPEEGVSAHTKVDPATGELLFFNYGKQAPYMHYGVVGADKTLKHFIPIELQGPRLPHDMAFTTNYSILPDLPMFWDQEALKHDAHAVRFYPNLPSRFAIVPRHGSVNEIKWFEADPTFVLHWCNAWEVGEEIVLEGYFQENPEPGAIEDPKLTGKLGRIMAAVDQHRFRSKLHRWRFNLRTGKTIEERLDEDHLEFGTFNQLHAGKKSRYVYSAAAKPGWFLFTGLVKHDTETGDRISIDFGEERYGSEAPLAPRIGAKDEDDGYIVSFITDMKQDRSECIVLDAKDIAAGPICQIVLPHRISSGTHATWASHEEAAGKKPPQLA